MNTETACRNEQNSIAHLLAFHHYFYKRIAHVGAA